MYAFLIAIHVIVCFVLIFVVLLQAGRGGGFSEMVGGGQPQSIFGTQTNTFMMRATEVCAVLFIVTSLSLGMLTSQRSKSLVEKELRSNPLKAMKTVFPPSGGGKETPKAVETKPVETKPVEAKPVETKPEETKKN